MRSFSLKPDLFAGIAWRGAVLATLALSALVAWNTIPFFSFRMNFAFFEDKGDLALDPVWRAFFYMHISGGLLCLASGPLLLWPALLERSRRLHRWIGWAYVLAVLGWAGPSGFYLSLHAKGGLPGKSAFLLLTILWWGSTALGLAAILKRRTSLHLRWMLRSYALALSAVFFRILHVGLFAAGASDELNYPLSLWLSVVASLAAGEALISLYLPKGAQP